MAGEAISAAGPYPHVRSDGWIAEAGYLALLLLIFVSLSPFAIRDPVALAAGESGFSSAGDIVRQLAFLGTFVVIAFSAWRQEGSFVLRSVSPLLMALLAWCLLSASWATEPDVSFRRGVLASVIVVSAMMSVSAIGPARALVLLRYVLAGVLIVNWLSIPLVPQAVHLAGETDPGLVGDWRGLYFHKNIAGSVSAVTAILFFFSMLSTRRIIDLLLFLAAVAFTFKTHSKSSLGLLPVALALGLIYRFAWQRGIDRFIVGIGAALVAIVVVAVGATYWSAISHILEDPTQFTGRAAIWQGEFAFIRDHPLLGSGYGTFADTGALSPLHNYVGDAWVQNVSHGHNAYLQLLVTIGGVGFALSILVLVVMPLWAFLRDDGSQIEFKALLFAIFAFVVLHNALESDFLEGDSAIWLTFLLVLAILRNLHKTPRSFETGAAA
jgi:exopolysaccharide production protein ExoQ